MLLLRSIWQRNFRPILKVLGELLRDDMHFLSLVVRSRTTAAAEILFLRKQLAYYQEHKVRPRRLSDAARLSLVMAVRLSETRLSFFGPNPQRRCSPR